MSDDLSVPIGVELRPIPGFSNGYAAGSDGHIYRYSTSRVNAKKPRPFRLSESIGSAEYPFVSIIDEPGGRSRAVHVLVCGAFHGPKPSPMHEVRHLDGMRRNSLPNNLRWGTAAENEADKKRHGTAAIGEKHGAAKLSDEAVRILRASIPRGLWNASDAAAVFGVTPSVIRDAVNGRTWAHITSAEKEWR